MFRAEELYQMLLAAYGKPRWWSDDPFTVMFQAVLVQNTTWSCVEKTSEAMGDRLHPEYIENLPVEELEEQIRPCGFCKAKARTIQALTAWFRRYDFDREEVRELSVTKLRSELLAIRGIGAETADVILVYAFYQASFIIDAYTRRLLTRLGYAFSHDAAIRQFFETDLPRDARLYGWYHWLILEHGIAVCQKRPKCERCPLQAVCRQSDEMEDAAHALRIHSDRMHAEGDVTKSRK